MSRGVRAGAVVLALVTCLLVGCSCSIDDPGDDVTSSSAPDVTRMCELLAPPRELMGKEHLTVEEALTEPGEAGDGIRAMFALVGASKAEGGGRFRPALEYLRDRWETESYEGKHPRAPSATVIANARELDRFLAEGGCG